MMFIVLRNTYSLIGATMCSYCLLSNQALGQAASKPTAFDPVRFGAMITDSMHANNFPALSIGVVQDGRIIYSKGFGYADFKTKAPATDATTYQIGSLSKTITGNLLARLILAGKIRLDEPMSNFFTPDVRFPVDSTGRVLTIKDLATHSSGLPRYPANLDRMDGEPMKGYTLAQMVEAINTTSLEFNIGRRYGYSNWGYGILGVAMENRMGKSFAQLLNEYAIGPLGMEHSSAVLSDNVRNLLATAYYDDNTGRETKPWEMGTLAPHGGVFSNVEDLCKFMVYMADTTDPAVRLQRTAHFKISARTDYGLGCFITTYQEPKYDRIIYHGGDLDSYSSNWIFYPDRGFSFIVLTTGAGGEPLGRLHSAIEDELKRMLSTTADVPPAMVNDSAAVRAAMLDYIEGFYQGDSAKIIRSISPHVVKYGYWKQNTSSPYVGESMSHAEMLAYAHETRAKSTQAAPDAVKRIELLGLQDQTASGKVTAWWGTDYVLLEKVKNKWMIRMVLWQGPLK